MKVVARTLDHGARDASGPAPETGVVLLHLGGPTGQDDVERFQVALWSEPAIAPGHASEAQAAFATDGSRWQVAWAQFRGRSAAQDFLAAQAIALENRLNGLAPLAAPARGPYRVFVGTRFGAPSIADAVGAARAAGVHRLVGVPMYPHPSPAWSGLCAGAFLAAAPPEMRPIVRNGMHRARGFVDALVRRAASAVDLIPPKFADGVFLLLAARSPPEANARKDPSLQALEETSQAVMKALHFHESRTAVAFTNFGGPGKWLEPNVEQLAVELGKDQRQAVVIVPVSTVTDDLETLYELDTRLSGALAENGVKQLRRAVTLNADPYFIAALADLVIG